MLTKRENLHEVMTGGQPDRYVNQFEYLYLVFFADPYTTKGPVSGPGLDWKTPWGVTYSWPEWAPGGMPIHKPETIVLHDVKDWKSVLKAPNVQFPEEDYQPMKDLAAGCDRNDQYLAMAVFPGLFEATHLFMGMEGALTAIALEPETVREMIEWYVDWEIEYAQTIVSRIHPDALLHHDDWGTQISTFMSPAMFREVYLEPYKRLYGWYKANGVELIVHHSDSFAATFVPMMIEMGIDIYQGAMTTNKVPELIAQYGGQISFHGALDNGVIDRENWTPELIDREVRRAVKECGKLYYIPGLVAGGPGSTFPEVYEAISEKIDELSKEDF
ncbi:MAG: hypothetical protein LBU61_00850 [Coriobacteriales bacterium]|jgi:hypothetical protein|nr:hypothetical protein [Coriobacteriales bacterium]